MHEMITYHHSEQENLQQDFANLTNSIECRLTSSFDIVEKALYRLKDAYEAKLNHRELLLIMQSYCAMDPSLFTLLSIIDKDGQFILSSQEEAPNTRVLDRNYLMYHQNVDSKAIYIDTPAWGIFHTDPYIPVSVRINDPQGDFAGVILVLIDMQYIYDIFRSLHFDFDFQTYLADSYGRIYNGVIYENHHPIDIKDNNGIIKYKNGELALSDSYFATPISESLVNDRIVRKSRVNIRENANTEYTIYMVFEIFMEKWHERLYRNITIETVILFFSLVIVGIFLFFYYKSASKKDKKFSSIRIQSDKLNNMLNATGVATWEWNIQTDEILINQNFADMYGYSLRELYPMSVKKWHEIIIPEDRPRVEQAFADHIAGMSSTYEYECRIKQKNDNVIWVHTIGKVVYRDKDGKPVWLYGVDQDVTEVKNTQELYNQNQKLESVGTLAGGIAHEFNNILAGVYGFIELALLRIQDEKVKHFLRSSVASIDKAKLLTSKLITFSEGGQLVITSAVIEFFLRKSITNIIKNKAYTLSFHNMTDAWPVFYDKNQIFNVLSNILQNAMEAMPGGGHISISVKNLYVSTHNTLNPGYYVKISIADDGEGIPPDLVFKLYDPFFTTKPSRQGLGLTVSYSIVKKHNGCIDFEANPGGGSIFHLYLPAVTEPKDLPDPDTINEQSLGKILILEDDDVSRDIFVQLLSILGYDVLISYNPNQMLNLFNRFKDDDLKVIIIDLESMRASQNFGLIKSIRNVDVELCVFITSTDPEEDMMQNPRTYQFTDCIVKPFIMLDLESKIEANCKK